MKTHNVLPADPSSPCIRMCCLDNNDICLGCFRSLEEIMRWNNTDAVTRQQFLQNAAQRKQHYQQT
jgi:uncharacterized protein